MTIYKETGLHRHPDGKEGKDWISATHLALLCGSLSFLKSEAPHSKRSGWLSRFAKSKTSACWMHPNKAG